MMDTAYDSCTIETGRELCAAGLAIACAESCTGGLLTSTLTDVPGSSSYVMGSIVSYSNDVKSRVLHVSEDTLASYGAVSEETAREMAEGVRKLMGTDIGVGITGIAGPDGGTAENPVGLVWFGFATKQRIWAKHYQFSGSREEIRRQAVQYALAIMEHYLKTNA